MKSFILALIVLMSVNAFATKARLQALNNSFHVVDPQTMFGNPLDVMGMKNFISLESGSQTVTNTSENAEGSISYGLNDHSQFAVAVGHKDDAIMGVRSLINNTTGLTYDTPQNPIHLFYGIKGEDVVYAFNISYSNKNVKVTPSKESSALASFGAQWGNYQAYVVTTLINTAEYANNKFEGAGYVNLAGRLTLDTMTLGLDLYTAKAKSSTASVETASDNYQAIVVGLVDVRSKDGSDFFYGAQAVASDLKNRTMDKDFKRTTLPIWFGIEAKGNDWLTVRGSIQQTILINQSKDDAGFAAGDGYLTGATGSISDFSAAPNNTTVAMGLGFNFKNVTVDGVLKGLMTANGGPQEVNSANFLSQVGLTYNY
ncbi:MAG: hypothetical protein H7256_09910 [Bdellovibrio sp.]|nr:hypothetical protein [Bdellovibrio sp.]